MIQTEKLINDFVYEVLDTPCFGFLATLDNNKKPIMTRHFGFKYNEELSTFIIYTFKKDFLRMRGFLTPGVNISCVVSNPIDFKTIQLKGTFDRWYDTPEVELNIPSSTNAKQAEIMKQWGVPTEIFSQWHFKPSIAVVMNVLEIYNQTPKVNTGNKIN